MIRLHSHGELEERPGTFAYYLAMDAYANKGDVQGASDVTKTMKDDFNSGKVTRMRSQTLGATAFLSKHGQNQEGKRHQLKLGIFWTKWFIFIQMENLQKDLAHSHTTW